MSSNSWFVRKQASQTGLKIEPNKGVVSYFILECVANKQELIALIQKGAFTGSDEVCAVGDHWFYLSDSAEIKQQLGIDPVLAHSSSEDQTLPSLQLEEATQPEILAAMEAQSSNSSSTSVTSLRKAEVQEIKKPVLRLPPKQSNLTDTPLQTTEATFLEKAGLWLFIFFIAVVGSIVGFVWILRSLRL